MIWSPPQSRVTSLKSHYNWLGQNQFFLSFWKFEEWKVSSCFVNWIYYVTKPTSAWYQWSYCWTIIISSVVKVMFTILLSKKCTGHDWKTCYPTCKHPPHCGVHSRQQVSKSFRSEKVDTGRNYREIEFTFRICLMWKYSSGSINGLATKVTHWLLIAHASENCECLLKYDLVLI